MKLTEKAKVDFEEWILNSPQGHDSQRMIKIRNQKDLFISYVGIGGTFLNALIIEWLDTVGFFISVYSLINDNGERRFTSDINEDYFTSCEERPLATTEAIKTANKLYNKKWK